MRRGPALTTMNYPISHRSKPANDVSRDGEPLQPGDNGGYLEPGCPITAIKRNSDPAADACASPPTRPPTVATVTFESGRHGEQRLPVAAWQKE